MDILTDSQSKSYTEAHTDRQIAETKKSGTEHSRDTGRQADAGRQTDEQITRDTGASYRTSYIGCNK